MNDDVKKALARFAKFCRAHSGQMVRVYDYNADDIEAALANIDEAHEAAAKVVAAWEFSEIGQIDGELIERLKKATHP
jgi:copper homeostasis protein CutC